MPHIAHFAINADDVPRARRFYERVFGWTFSAWGPPGFYQIQTGTEATEATAKAVIAAGGKTVIPKSIIVGVGALMFFQDPEGNVFGAMEFDRHAE